MKGEKGSGNAPWSGNLCGKMGMGEVACPCLSRSNSGIIWQGTEALCSGTQGVCGDRATFSWQPCVWKSGPVASNMQFSM